MEKPAQYDKFLGMMPNEKAVRAKLKGLDAVTLIDLMVHAHAEAEEYELSPAEAAMKEIIDAEFTRREIAGGTGARVWSKPRRTPRTKARYGQGAERSETAKSWRALAFGIRGKQPHSNETVGERRD